MTDVERTRDAWMKSRCTTAFLYALMKEAELNQFEALVGEPMRTNSTMIYELKAAVTNYQALCREAGIQPYELLPGITYRQMQPKT